MRNNFYSFSDAFREANRKQKIEYFTSEQKQAQLTATRRQFRSFLIALDIEYGLLKDPEEKSKFDNSKEKSESKGKKRKKDKRGRDKIEEKEKKEQRSIYSEYVDFQKNVPYSFNTEGFNLAVHFICNWKDAEYKKMRKRKFSVENRSKYKEIISAVKSNMAALDYSQEIIFEQECAFWHNIAQNSHSSVLNFLDIGTLFKNDVQNLPRQLSLKEEEDLIYLNNMICHYYELFQQKWSRRIERMLQERRRQAENVKLSQEAECFVGEISEKLLAADNSTQYSNLDLKSQKQQDTSETQLWEWLLALGTHLVDNNDVPPIPRIVSSQELYDSLFGEMDAKEDEILRGELNTELQ